MRGGLRRALQVHDLIAAAWPGDGSGRAPPSSRLMGVIPTHRTEVDHPFRQLIDAQARGGPGRPRHGRAAVRLAAAVHGHLVLAAPPPRGTAHVGAARCLIALGRVDEAVPHAEAAADCWPLAGWRRGRARAVQRRLGIGAEPSGPAELTPREREVAALLAEGLSNAALARAASTSRRAPRRCTCRTSSSKLGMGIAHRGRGSGRRARGSRAPTDQSTTSGASLHGLGSRGLFG
jgi:hypothetical protein